MVVGLSLILNYNTAQVLYRELLSATYIGKSAPQKTACYGHQVSGAQEASASLSSWREACILSFCLENTLKIQTAKKTAYCLVQQLGWQSKLQPKFS